MARISREDLRFLLLEGLMVLFGVLAALLVDEWRENRELDRNADAAMARVVAEVRQNLNEIRGLDSTVTRRRERLDSLRQATGDAHPLSWYASRFGGYSTAALSEGAWQRLSTGAVADHVPPAFIEDAFALYALNPYLKQLDQEVTDLVFSELNYDPARAPAALDIARQIMEQQMRWADRFVPRYEAFLERWGGGG